MAKSEKELELLDEMLGLVIELMNEADQQRGTGTKEIYLSQEILEELWEVTEEIKEFNFQGGKLQ